MTDFICPHCGEDLRKAGFYENVTAKYDFAYGTFAVEEVNCIDTEAICCGSCHEDIDLQFECSLSISRKIASKKVRTRYGNVIKEDYHE